MCEGQSIVQNVQNVTNRINRINRDQGSRGPQGGPGDPQGPLGAPGAPQGGPGGPWGPWGPWAHGPHGPHGAHGAHGGPMGPNWANVPPLGKTFFRKSTKKSGMSTFGSKTKVVRAEILHILVPIPSRGDLYLTISWISTILSKLGFLIQFLMCSLF